MVKLIEIILKINVPTKDLNLELLQGVLIISKKSNTFVNEDIEIWNQVLEILWAHLQTGLKKIDDQLLCAICFYTVLNLTDKQELYVSKVLQIIHEEILLRAKENKPNSTEFQVVSLMYGIFQSAFFTQKVNIHTSLLEGVLKSMFNLLILMGYEYSQYTFIIFKTMNSFKKLCNTELQGIVFNKDNQVKLLNLINHNWENPISGIRDLNKGIFQTLISTVDTLMYKLIVHEINHFYWNKAKYLMLSEVVESYKNNISFLIKENNWIEGLLYSLHKPGLVSAGADLYYSILKKTRSEHDWCDIFLCSIIKVLNGLSNKAIENFYNYWCLTTLKKYPSLLNIFIEDLEKLDNKEQKLYNILCIIRQGNKLGIAHRKETDDDEQIEEEIIIGVEHLNPKIRLLAFDIVCKSHSKSMPNQKEYELVLEYLSNNVNSDCTVLRLSLLSSLNTFLTQLHVSFLTNMKNNDSIGIKSLLSFCKRMQEIVIGSVNLNGNYQRKLTCVKVISTLFVCFKEVPKKKRDQTRVIDETFTNFLKDNKCWMLNEEDFIMKLLSLLKDPADDIRENVNKLLLNNYSKELRRTEQLNNLIYNALTSIKSKYFYTIHCGQTMFKLIVNLLLKENHDEATFKSVNDIFLFATTELFAAYRLKWDIIESIENGKQLHSFISILLVVLEVCLLNSYKLEITNLTFLQLLDTLHGISNQFSWEQQNLTSSDFSKMNDMVENIIAKSGHSTGDENDQTKISGLHQIVLNCLWLNVKATCDLAAILIQFTEDKNKCEECLTIITNVLETSRHKGAIEAAGAALGRGIQYLTQLPEESEISELPKYLLKNKLTELISEANRLSSITRRGAGLSIMVHRIVSSDMKKRKPLFHYFIQTLLTTCNNTEDIPDIHVDNDNLNIENENDLPKAIFIHFLTKIVTDSSLATDVMYYSAELAELAFSNLTSSHWQIRNAALQLYGALIPRQIGQKKDSGTDEETIATVACDELRTHSPILWEYITKQLNVVNKPEILQFHSNLVPILNMLANMANRYNFSYDMEQLMVLDKQLFESLIRLLESPIYVVRRLAAKSIFNIFSFNSIYNVLLNFKCGSENLLHGSLTLLKCYKYYSSNHTLEANFVKLKEKFKDILNTGEHSFMCKEIFEDMFYTHNFGENYLQNIFSMVDSNMHAPGIFLWAETILKNYIHHSQWIDIPRILTLLLDRNDFEKYCSILHVKLQVDRCIFDEVILQIVNILLSFKKKFDSYYIWKILYQISTQFELKNNVDVATLIKDLEGRESLFKTRYIIPFTASLLAYTNEESQLTLANIILKFSDFEVADVDMRFVAALANNELGKVFRKLPDNIKIISIKTAVLLLQDEDDDVRNLSVNFYKSVTDLNVALHPYLCLCKIFDYTFLQNVFKEPQSVIEILHRDLSDILLHTSNDNTDEYNPFANDSKNIYLETELLRQLMDNLKNA